MAGFHVTPDKKIGLHRRLQRHPRQQALRILGASTWRTNRIAKTAEVPCRSRFSFGMSTDGKKLYIYGAGFEIEVYDAATLKYESTWDLNNDVTGSMIALR